MDSYVLLRALYGFSNSKFHIFQVPSANNVVRFLRATTIVSLPVPVLVIFLFVWWNTLTKNNLGKKKWFILAYCSVWGRGHHGWDNICSTSSMRSAWKSGSTYKKQREKQQEVRTDHKTLKSAPSALFSLARLHLLKFPWLISSPR